MGVLERIMDLALPRAPCTLALKLCRAATVPGDSGSSSESDNGSSSTTTSSSSAAGSSSESDDDGSGDEGPGGGGAVAAAPAGELAIAPDVLAVARWL